MHLSPRDLLVLQRVCRMWKNIIDTSKPIRQALRRNLVNFDQDSIPLLPKCFEKIILKTSSFHTAQINITKLSKDYKRESWRQMHFTNAPIKSISFGTIVSKRLGVVPRVRQSQRGFTAGGVVDELVKDYESHKKLGGANPLFWVEGS